MPKPLTAVLAWIAEKKIPPVILVGGSSEYLAQRAFHDLRDAIVSHHGEEGALTPLIEWTSQMKAFWQGRFDGLEDLLGRMDQ